MGAASTAAPIAAMAKRPSKGSRCCGAALASSTPPIQIAATAKVTPPTQVELSTPATTTSTNAASKARLSRRTSSDSSSIASTTQEAEAMCCGTQAVWNSQPAKPVGRA